MPIVSPNTSNKNFELTILFNVIERSGNYFFRDDKPHTALRARFVMLALGAYKLYIERVLALGAYKVYIERVIV